MYNKRQITAYMRQFNATVTDLQPYRRIKQGALTAHAVAQRDGLDIVHVSNIQYVIRICQIEARRVGFNVGMTTWESGDDNVFGCGMTLVAQLYNYHPVL